MKIKRFPCYLALIAAFLIGNYQGYIALWINDSSVPYRVYPYSVASLPAEDQRQINRGIPIETEAQLHRLLEDYLS